jgi:hypothetical protein
VKERKKTEEQQKDCIFDIFTKCHSETASGRLQVYYPELCEQIYRWYSEFLSIDVDKMGLEIVKVINRSIKDENISKIPDDKDGFFKYLNASIMREKASFYREYNENDTIKIPKEKKRKLREVEDFIRMKESQLGRKITSDELIQGISKWFKNHEYVDLLNSLNVGSLSYVSNDKDNKSDDLNYINSLSYDPLVEYINKTDKKSALEAVKSLLEKKQERSRDCYRALFTLHCIENYKDFEELYPVLDKNILETCQKDGKSPNQYEIYQIYHPNAQKYSAEAMASKNLHEFLNDIETYLKKNINNLYHKP